MALFDEFHEVLIQLQRTNPYVGELHYEPTNQWALLITLRNDDGTTREVLVSRVIHANGNYRFYGPNDEIIANEHESNFGSCDIHFRMRGEYLTK